MAWSNISKPGAQTYTNVNPMGREQYDQSNLTYDDANVFYDGGNPAMWTDVSKPTSGYDDLTWEEMAMDWQNADQAWQGNSPWNRVMKPQ